MSQQFYIQIWPAVPLRGGVARRTIALEHATLTGSILDVAQKPEQDL